MIRILIVDDHPAMRAGLTAVLRGEPGFVALHAATSATDLWPELIRTRPDVVVLDYRLPDDDGLVLCRRIKRQIPAPAVLLHSAYADASLTIPARLAGAEGLINKSAPANELYDAIRRVARGERMHPPLDRELLDRAGSQLPAEDLPILGMAVGGHADRRDRSRPGRRAGRRVTPHRSHDQPAQGRRASASVSGQACASTSQSVCQAGRPG